MSDFESLPTCNVVKILVWLFIGKNVEGVNILLNVGRNVWTYLSNSYRSILLETLIWKILFKKTFRSLDITIF